MKTKATDLSTHVDAPSLAPASSPVASPSVDAAPTPITLRETRAAFGAAQNEALMRRNAAEVARFRARSHDQVEAIDASTSGDSTKGGAS